MDYSTLANKLLEFRAIACDPGAVDRSIDEEYLRRYKWCEENRQIGIRNAREMEARRKGNAVRLNSQKQYECNLLSKMKSEEVRNILKEEQNKTEESLAANVKRKLEEEDRIIHERTMLRETEPELRDLASKIRAKLVGRILESQIHSKRVEKMNEIKQEVEWEKQLLKADAMEESYEIMKSKLRDEKLREEARQFTYDKLTGNTQKDRDARADKEESKRIIDRLVAEENKQIEKEAEERKRINERIRKEYQKFIEQCEKDKAKKADEIEFERQLLKEFSAYNNRLDERKQVKKDRINERIKKQEAVAEVVAKLNEEHEKARYGFLDINESIENSLACLENLDWEKNHAEKRKQVLDNYWENVQNLHAIKEKERKEEIERERELERQILEKAQREKAELEAKKLAEKKRLCEEMKKYRQEHIAQNQSRLCKEKEEYEVYLKELEKHRAKVEAERQAMLKEYAEYLKNDACGDTDFPPEINSKKSILN